MTFAIRENAFGINGLDIGDAVLELSLAPGPSGVVITSVGVGMKNRLHCFIQLVFVFVWVCGSVCFGVCFGVC